jgi:methylmalonyl-CoA mutase C-terminal domain/subunit
MKANGQDDVLLFLGGIIPDEDIAQLEEMGVSGIYGPGASTEEIVEKIRTDVLARA